MENKAPLCLFCDETLRKIQEFTHFCIPCGKTFATSYACARCQGEKKSHRIEIIDVNDFQCTTCLTRYRPKDPIKEFCPVTKDSPHAMKLSEHVWNSAVPKELHIAIDLPAPLTIQDIEWTWDKKECQLTISSKNKEWDFSETLTLEELRDKEGYEVTVKYSTRGIFVIAFVFL